MDDALRRLADAHGVTARYRDGLRRPVEVDAEVVVRVLGLLGVEAGTSADRRRERARLDGHRAPALPPTIALRAGSGRPLPAAGTLTGEDGSVRTVAALPADLPLGWYRLSTDLGEATVIVAPAALDPAPPAWGWMLQLYALRSGRSWGIGDLGDLRELADWAGRQGAGAVLLNPLHAPAPTHPVQPSPYTPSSRRFTNPLAIAVTELDAYQRADPDTRAEVDALRVADTPLIEHDVVWAAKRSALELLWRSAGRPVPEMSSGLRDFATWCALAERHGGQLGGALLLHPGVELSLIHI